MNDSEFCRAWRQVRIFSSRTDNLWYLTLLGQVVKPVSASVANVPFFFSMYQAPKEVDDGDTSIEDLPSEFLHQTPQGQIHRCIRLRFLGNANFERGVENAIRARPELWRSAILDYAIVNDLGGPRFCPDQLTMAAREHRARLVAEALESNCMFLLDTLQPTQSGFCLEPNSDMNSAILRTSGQSVLHMLCNIWVCQDGRVLPVGVGSFHRL